MALKYGNLAEVTIDGTEITDFTDSVTWNRTRDTGETSVFGLSDKTYVSGLRDATFALTGKYDSTATTGPAAVLNAQLADEDAVTFVIEVEGTGAGLGSTSGSCLITAYSESAPVGGVITWSADFQVTGTVTVTNQV